MANERVTPNYRIGAYYGLGSIPVAALSILGWPWTAPLAWGALSLAIQSLGYLGAGPGIDRKENGRLSILTRLLLGPILFGQYVSLLYYRHQSNAWDEALPGLLMGQLLDDAHASKLLEFSETPLLREQTNYRNLPILDLTAPTPAQLRDAVAFIRDNTPAGVVYVHCKAGYSRTAAAVGAYLMASGEAEGVDAAMAHMRDARSPLVIRPEVVAALQAFEEAGR